METDKKIASISGVGSFGLGAALQIIGYQNTTLSVVLGLISAACFSYAFLISKKTPPSSSVSDWLIRDLYLHIDPGVLQQDNTAQSGAVGKSILDRLSTGQLGIWGRTVVGDASLENLFKEVQNPLVKIIPEYWQNADFSDRFLSEQNQLVPHTYPKNGSGLPSYADLQVNKSEVLKLWPAKAGENSSLWFAFSAPILLLSVLGIAMAYPQWKYLLSNVPKSVPPAGIKVGMADIQKGPQIKDGELSIRIPVTNMSGSPLIITVKSTSFVFEGTKFSYPEKVLQYPLAKDEVIYFSYPSVSNLPKAVAAYNFELGIDVDYGSVDGPMERTVSRKLNCTAPVDSFEKGICIVVSSSDMEFNYAAQK